MYSTGKLKISCFSGSTGTRLNCTCSVVALVDRLQQIRHAVRRGVPIAVVNDLPEHELIARGIGRLVIHLLVVEEPAVLILGQAIGDDVRAQLQSASCWS